MPAKPAASRPAVIFIATKQEWIGRSLESILAPLGYAVVTTYTARDALERARRIRPDAIIVDAFLPDGDGRDLCRQLRARELITPSTPIVLTVPQSPTRRDRLAALQAGAWDCLGQPLDAEELAAVLAAFVPAKLDADEARFEGLVDDMTGLYNVQGLTRRAQELGALASRRRLPLACVLLAPDSGVEAASPDVLAAVLRRIAQVLKAVGRACDAIGRVGPTGFAVMGAGTDAVQVRKLAERLAGAILAVPPAASEPAPSLQLHAGCVGVADFHAASIDPVELLLRATAALQKARSDPQGGWLRGFDEGAAEN